MDDLIAKVEKKYLKEQLTDARPGDTVRVVTRITEGGGDQQRTRTQTFEGVIIARRGGGVNENITVRRVSLGIGVERTFPLHSPLLEDIEVVRRGNVRRAKLYYLRERRGRAARVREQARVRTEPAAEAQEAPELEPTQAQPSEEEVEPEPTEVAASEEPVAESASEDEDQSE